MVEELIVRVDQLHDRRTILAVFDQRDLARRQQRKATRRIQNPVRDPDVLRCALHRSARLTTQLIDVDHIRNRLSDAKRIKQHNIAAVLQLGERIHVQEHIRTTLLHFGDHNGNRVSQPRGLRQLLQSQYALRHTQRVCRESRTSVDTVHVANKANAAKRHREIHVLRIESCDVAAKSIVDVEGLLHAVHPVHTLVLPIK